MPTVVKAYLGTTPLFTETGGGGGSSSAWVRPSDWLTLPSAEAESVKILHAVFDQAENYVVIKMQTADNSTYTINWGDGNSTTATSNTNTVYNYSYSAATLDGTLSSRGYKQAIITITPQTGKTFTLCDLSQKITSPTGMQMYATGLLDVNINLPSLTAGQRLFIGASAVRHSYLERVYIASWGLLNNASNLFAYCSALQSLNETEWNMANILTTASMFFSCSGIKVIDGSNWNMAKVTTIVDMFRDCQTLQKINCANWNLGACTSFSATFQACVALTEIDVSNWNTANVTTFAFTFHSCRSLVRLNVRNWNAAKITTMADMFNSCFALQEVDLSLWSLPLCTTASAAFANCHSLRKLGPCNFNSLTTLGTVFSACRSLTSCTVTNIRATVDFSNCRLSSTALNQIYNNLVAVGVARTITVTGNYGNVSDDITIATAKGWTVTG